MTDIAPGALGGWRHRTTFLLALAAAAVGMGSLWRFAWLLGSHGGGAFMVSYVAAMVLLAMPLLVAELVIGSHGRNSPPLALRWVADRSLLSRKWMALGLLACVSGALVLTCQVVVAGWTLSFIPLMQGGEFASASATLVADRFAAMLQAPVVQVTWQLLFMGAAVALVAQGIRRGIGMLAWLAVPALLALLSSLVLYALEVGNLAATRDFLFSVKWVDFTPDTVLAAICHALYTLGVGVGTGLAFGAYTPERTPLARTVMAVMVFDTLVALLVGVVVMSLVLANNIEPTAGPGLLYIALPYAFGNSAEGELMGTLFFVLVAVSSLCSAVALLEPAVASMMQMFALRRLPAALLVGGVIWVLAGTVTLSLVSDAGVGRSNLLVQADWLSAGLLLPLAALSVAVLVGWRLHPDVLRPQLPRESALFFSLWRAMLRYIAPLAIAAVLLVELFL